MLSGRSTIVWGLLALLPFVACAPAKPTEAEFSGDDDQASAGAGQEGSRNEDGAFGGQSGMDQAAGASGDVLPPEAGTSGSSGENLTGGHAGSASPASDAGAPPAGVPVFVAAGYGGRIAVSCDGGRKWQTVRQLGSPGDPHDENIIRGLAYVDGVFIALQGTNKARVLRSSDAVQWTEVHTLDFLSFDITFGGGRIVAGSRHGIGISRDLGLTWMTYPGPSGAHFRDLIFGDVGAGVFLAVGDSGRRVRSQDGVRWQDNVEGGDGLRAAFGNGRFVAIAENGDAFISADEGKSWQSRRITAAGGATPGAFRSILFDGENFMVSADKATLFSREGEIWQSYSGGVGASSVAVDRGGSYVGYTPGWSRPGRWHSSPDGRSWITQNDDRNNVMSRLVFGWAQPSSKCPDGLSP